MDREVLDMKLRIKAAVIHLLISLAVAVVSAVLVFSIWYPYPFQEISGGTQLFLLICTVDVIIGPLLTLVVFDARKGRKEIFSDLVIITVLQAAALVYGLVTIFNSRPVHVVFEYDRFRVVHAFEVDPNVGETSDGIVSRPMAGPTLLALRPFNNEKEKFEATMAALQGVSLSSRTELWVKYELRTESVLAAAKPLEKLAIKRPKDRESINEIISRLNLSSDQIKYLPMIARQSFWTVLLRQDTAAVIGYVPVDSF